MMAVHAAQKLPDEKSSLSARMASAVAAGMVAIDGSAIFSSHLIANAFFWLLWAPVRLCRFGLWFVRLSHLLLLLARHSWLMCCCTFVEPCLRAVAVH